MIESFTLAAEVGFKFCRTEVHWVKPILKIDTTNLNPFSFKGTESGLLFHPEMW
jgi:hypothetical protein